MRISDWSSDVCSSDIFTAARTIFECSRKYSSWKLIFGSTKRIIFVASRTTVFWMLDTASAGIGLPKIAHGDSTFMPPLRSEEHTSELQSLMRISYAVSCLKKKKKY